jgi:hypothetical protein
MMSESINDVVNLNAGDRCVTLLGIESEMKNAEREICARPARAQGRSNEARSSLCSSSRLPPCAGAAKACSGGKSDAARALLPNFNEFTSSEVNSTSL